jgi:hypothetical protein
VIRLALYKGPADGLVHKLGHWAVCIGTMSRYSHCELEIDGVCWSSSIRDWGVRGKVIDLTSGRWDVVEIPAADTASALAWFTARAGKPYDWPGVLRFALPFLRQKPGEWFCSESAAGALSLSDPSNWTPGKLGRLFGRPLARAVHLPWLPWAAIPLFPWLILIREKYRGDPALLAHEHVHCEQQRRHGWFRFWWYYLSRFEYRQQVEVDAYRAQIEAAAAAGAPRGVVLERCAQNLVALYHLPITLEQARELLS